MMVAGLLQHPAQDVVLKPALLLRSLPECPPAYKFGKHAARLHGQLVGGDMRRHLPHRGNCKGLMYSIFPPVRTELAEPENQVYAYIPDSGRLNDPVCSPGCPGIVPAVHPLQNPVVERLHTHTYAVHSHPGQSPDVLFPLFNDILRIDLDGKFVKLRPNSCMTEGLQHSLKKRRRQHRRSATTYV